MGSRFLAACIALAVFATANIAKAQGEDTDNATQIVQGCLLKGAASSTYMLTDENGKLWDIRSDRAPLAQHVGHTVKLTGTIPKPPKNSTDNVPQNHLAVTAVEMVRDNCKPQ
jgi:hypothetical protein